MPSAEISCSTLRTSTSSSTAGAVSSESITGAPAASSSTDFVPLSMSTELRHDVAGEQAHRREDLVLTQDLVRVEQEVDPRRADRLPPLHLLDAPVRVADTQALWEPRLLGGRIRSAGRRARREVRDELI